MSIQPEQIRLVSISETKTYDSKPGRLIVMGFFPNRGEPSTVTAQWVFPATINDGDVVRLARHYFHRLFSALSAASADWDVGDEEVARLDGRQSPKA